MFGIGMPEMILILAVALIVIGPKKLPDLAKSLGKAMGEFKKATRDLKDSMQIDTELKEVKGAFDDLGKDVPKPKVKAAASREPAAPTAAPDAKAPAEGDGAEPRPSSASVDGRNGDEVPAREDAGKDDVEPAPGADGDTEAHKA